MVGFYTCIVAFLIILAVFDLWVGVSNDAVNFLNSAIGAKVAKFRTVLLVASLGVLIGAVMSAGMMDVARHGIMNPSNFNYREVMTIFLAVMVTDVIVLDMFNTLGLPTSTTISLVFELLGGTFILALVKMHANPEYDFGDLLNSSDALKVIIAIFVSVAIAFFFGTVVQWISRVIFTFKYKSHLKYSIAIFGGISFTALAYFIFFKGLAGSPFISEDTKTWIVSNTKILMLYTFLGSTVLMELMHLLKIDVFRFIVLMGTFALAMAFAGNDLVNFIGVPLAGLSSFQDWTAHGAGDINSFMMTSLASSAKTPILYLGLAGVIMITAMGTSKKAKNVVKTSVDLSRQDEGDEMFGSSRLARVLIRFCSNAFEKIDAFIPVSVRKWINSRFDNDDAILENGAAFDMVRAAVNLVLSSMLIIIGTNYKIPLSTTYVTFMVAMGSSLADRAWSRESAVYRVTGVVSVIGGWFVTAGVAFAVCAIVSLCMYYGGFVVMGLFIILDIVLLYKSSRKYEKKVQEAKKDTAFKLMMRAKDPEILWDLLSKHVVRTQSFVCRFALDQFNKIMEGLTEENYRILKKSESELDDERDMLKKYRRQELLALRRLPLDMALERNTWFHLGVNSDQQFIYCLKRMLEPAKEHVENNFNPVPDAYREEFDDIKYRVNELMKSSEDMISTGRYGNYREVLAMADECKDELSVIRKRHINRMQQDKDSANLKISLVYLNILQECQEFLSIMRHQLRAAHKFTTDA